MRPPFSFLARAAAKRIITIRAGLSSWNVSWQFRFPLCGCLPGIGCGVQSNQELSSSRNSPSSRTRIEARCASAVHYELAKTYRALGPGGKPLPACAKPSPACLTWPRPMSCWETPCCGENNPRGALDEYQEYLRLDPSGLMAPGVRQMIQKIQKTPPP